MNEILDGGELGSVSCVCACSLARVGDLRIGEDGRW